MARTGSQGSNVDQYEPGMLGGYFDERRTTGKTLVMEQTSICGEEGDLSDLRQIADPKVMAL